MKKIFGEKAFFGGKIKGFIENRGGGEFRAVWTRFKLKVLFTKVLLLRAAILREKKICFLLDIVQKWPLPPPPTLLLCTLFNLSSWITFCVLKCSSTQKHLTNGTRFRFPSTKGRKKYYVVQKITQTG